MAARKYLDARCRLSGGSVTPVRVLDLSAAGCMVDKRMLRLKEGERVMVKFEGLSYLPSSVLWIEEETAGLVFERLLYAPVLERLDKSFMAIDPE